MIERVVFDTSTLIGAALKVGSKPHRALMLALDSCEICGCEQMITELAAVLNRSYFDRRLTRPDREAFTAMIRNNVVTYWVDETAAASLDPTCRDVSDNFILALALAAKADTIVSSDQDLLVLHPWRGIAILTPAQFLTQFAD
ncbi:MAG: putative toxin-antitoxin system toxin component, PIN family [Terracidiphilus sp.]|jgi:putative PIN family toxin of toxin-antitoxin system